MASTRNMPNPLIDPVKPQNTRELREQVARAARLDEAVAASSGGYAVINTQPTGPDVIPEPTVKNISISPGQKLALPFDEVTPPQVSASSWSIDGQREHQSASAEFNPSDANSFYGLKG